MDAASGCVRLATTVFVFVNILTSGSTLQCYSCSYTRAGTGVIDYDCVNASVSASSPMTCTSNNHVCTVQASYRQNFALLQSLLRGCAPRVVVVTKLNETACTRPDGYGSAECYFQCDHDLCNVVDGNLYTPPPSAAPAVTSFPAVTSLCAITAAVQSMFVR